MLYSVETGKYVKKLPHKSEFDSWMKNISASDYQKIIDALDQKIDATDINTSSWMPGNDWTGTVYEPLYLACGNNKEASGLFFGLVLFNHLMERKDAVWGFGRYEKDGIPIKGMTYFRLKNNP